MPIPRDLRKLLESCDFEAVEEAWLERASEAPEDIEFFVDLARGLVGTGEGERARMLVDLLDGQLVARSAWRPRMALLRGAAGLPVEARWVHDQVLATLRRLHGGSALLEPLLDKVGLHRAIEDLPKTWEKVARLEGLLAFDRGAIVAMAGRGVGRVVDVNLELESFKVEFGGAPALAVGFRGAPKLLQPLAPEHFLRRKLEDPAGLAELAERDPGGLLGELLASHPEPMTAAEIRQALAGIVSDARWTPWWAAARSHPRIMAHGGGRQTYSWAGSAEGASAAAWERFARGDRAEKLALFRRHSTRTPTLAARMAGALGELAAQLASQQPAAAFEIACALEREGLLPAGAEASPGVLVESVGDAAALVRRLDDRQLKERALRLARERRADWKALCAELLLHDDDPRLLDQAAAELAANDGELYERCLTQILSRPRQHAGGLVWLAERAAADEALRSRRPLLLLQHLLHAAAWDEMAPHRGRLKALWRSGGTLPRLLPLLTAGEAERAEEAIQRAAGLEEYEREPLLTALYLRFPALRREAEQPLYALPSSIAGRRAELKHLLEEEIPANRRAIEEARALGDLRENFEYKSARQRHEYLSARVAALHRDLGRARPLEVAAVDPAQVRIGCRVRLRPVDGGEVRAVTILGPWESRPEDGIVSYESDLGRKLLGLTAGDAVALDGREHRVEGIARAE